MKPRALADLLESYSSYVEQHDGRLSDLNFAKEVLALSSDATVKGFVKKLDKIELPQNSINGSSVAEVVEALTELKDLVAQTGAKAAANDLEALAVSLDRLKHCSPSIILEQVKIALAPKKKKKPEAPVRHDVIHRYLKKLEEALGDDPGFDALLRELEGDADLTANELIQLARQFTFAGTKSKGAALKKIRSRHAALMTSRAKSAATAGRIAG